MKQKAEHYSLSGMLCWVLSMDSCGHSLAQVLAG